MKKLTRRSFTAAGILAALGLSGCKEGFDPFNNRPASVYGPPPEEPDPSYDPANNIPVDVYGPPVEDYNNYEPSRNEQACVYDPLPR